jgi:hypothetical protein
MDEIAISEWYENRSCDVVKSAELKETSKATAEGDNTLGETQLPFTLEPPTIGTSISPNLQTESEENSFSAFADEKETIVPPEVGPDSTAGVLIENGATKSNFKPSWLDEDEAHSSEP